MQPCGASSLAWAFFVNASRGAGTPGNPARSWWPDVFWCTARHAAGKTAIRRKLDMGSGRVESPTHANGRSTGSEDHPNWL